MEEEGRSRSSSFSSSSSSNSWSIIENPEDKVREGHEATDSEQSSGLADDDLLFVKKSCTEFRPDLTLLEDDTATDCFTESEDDDISVVSESDEETAEQPLPLPFVDVTRVSKQLDILSKCYDSPVERFFSQMFESESNVKTLIVVIIAAFSLAVAALANAAGNGWTNSVPSAIMESACAAFDDRLLGLQYREVDVTPLRPSVELPLKPTVSWAAPPSVLPDSPPFTYFAQFQKIRTYEHDYMQASLNQCDRAVYEREFSAMDEAVRRYVRHTELRKKSRQATGESDARSTSLNTTHVKASDSATNGSTHWRVPLLNMSIEKPKVLKSIAEKYTWQNVTASLLGLPVMANRVLRTSTVVKMVAESKVTAKFHNAFSLMRQSLHHRLARVKVHRDRVIRAVASSFAKFSFPSAGHKLWSELSRLTRKKAESKACSAANVCCDRFTPLAVALRESCLFASLVGEVNARTYIESLQGASACTEVRINCEKCWWTGDCPKERCSFLSWQRSFNTHRFVVSQREHLRPAFIRLGWRMPTGRRASLKGETEEKAKRKFAKKKGAFVESPSESSDHAGYWFFERGRLRETQRDADDDWFVERGRLRATQRNAGDSWFVERGQLRATQRNANDDWFFERGRHRETQRGRRTR